MSNTLLFEKLDQLVDDCAGARGDWDDVLQRALVLEPPAPPRPRRVRSRRALVWAVAVSSLAVILFATPAFGLLRDWIGRKDVPFTGKTAPLVVKRDFADLSLGMQEGLFPQAIASQTRKVGVFRASGKNYVLYVAPIRKGGFCAMFSDLSRFLGCLETRPIAKDYPNSHGAVNPYLLKVSVGQWDVSGLVFAKDAASLSVEYQDGSSEQIPFVYVSKPIDAGFFLHGFRQGVAAVSVRDSRGKLIARWTSDYSPPPPKSLSVTPRYLRSPPPLPTKPTPPLQRGRANGVSAVAGKNGFVIFDLSGASEKVRALLAEGASTDCFAFTPYHEESPAGAGGGFNQLRPRVVQVYQGLATPFDGCTIRGRYGHRWPDRLHSHDAVEIAFTARAKTYFADHAAARDLALFVGSNRMRQIRRLSGEALETAISRKYGTAITHLPSSVSPLPPGRIGYSDHAYGATFFAGEPTFFEYSTTGRRFYVTINKGKIASENVRELTLLR